MVKPFSVENFFKLLLIKQVTAILPVEKPVEILWKSCGKLWLACGKLFAAKSFPQIFEFSTGSFEKFSTDCGKLLLKHSQILELLKRKTMLNCGNLFA